VTTSLVIQTSFLGDTVLTTPLITELARRGPVDVVTTRASAPLLAHHPGVRHVIAFDKSGADRGARGLARASRRIRAWWRERGDDPRHAHAYLAQGSPRSALLAVLARVPARIGFDDAAGRLFYTHRVPRRPREHHAARLLSLAGDRASHDRDAASITPRLYPGDEDRRAVDALVATHEPRPIVALAPGSIWGTKRWPYYRELAARLSPRVRVAVVGGPEDAELARNVVDAAGADAIDATGTLSVLASAELIRRAILLVTNDSLPQHLASAVGTPTITIFGPTVPEFGFGPLAPNSMTLGVETLACRPCHHHGPRVCPLSHWRCMRELTVERVDDAVAYLTAGAAR